MSVASAMAALEKGAVSAPTVEVKVADPVEPIKEEAKPVDAAAEPEKKEEVKKEESPDSKRFAELSKKEQRILDKKMKMEKELKAREDALKARESVIEEYEEVKKLAKTNPSEAIKKIGTDYKSLTEHILNGEKLTPELVAQDVDAKIKQLEEKLAAQEASFKEREAQKAAEENKRILESFSANIVETVKTKADSYPAVAAFDGAPVIYEMIQKRWHDTEGKHLMTIEEAADILEKDLDSVISKVMQSPKYAARFSPSKKEETKPTSLNKPKTITNELTSTAPSMLPAKTENDRIKRALEKLSASS